MTLKRITDIGLYCFTAIAVLVITFSVYYTATNVKYTMGVNNIGDQLGLDIVKSDDLTQTQKNALDERWFMEAKYFDNANKNGIALQELNFNYFQDWTLTSNVYRASGMQYLGDYTHTIKKYSDEAYINNMLHNDFYYYDTTNGISWEGARGNAGSIGTKLNRNTEMIIKIDNKPYAIRMTGSHSYRTGWWIFGSTTTVYYTYPMLFDRVFDAIKSNSRGYGEYYITLDLSSFFSISEYDQNTGKYKPDNVTNIIKNYAVLKFTYEPNGARASSQSMFGIIACNSKYDLSPPDYNTDYWQERLVYNLTQNDLHLRHSTAFDGSFVSLGLNTRQLFATMPRAKVNITINLDGTDIRGLDYSAFENFEIDTLTITSSTPTDFHLFNNSLKGTRLKNFVASPNINVIGGVEL